MVNVVARLTDIKPTIYYSVDGSNSTFVILFSGVAEKHRPNPEYPIAEHEANKIMLIALPIGNNRFLQSS